MSETGVLSRGASRLLKLSGTTALARERLVTADKAGSWRVFRGAEDWTGRSPVRVYRHCLLYGTGISGRVAATASTYAKASSRSCTRGPDERDILLHLVENHQLGFH